MLKRLREALQAVPLETVEKELQVKRRTATEYRAGHFPKSWIALAKSEFIEPFCADAEELRHDSHEKAV